MKDGLKRVNWSGQHINFDVIQKRVFYAVEGVFEFTGEDRLNVRVFYSGSLEPKQSEPKPEKQEPKAERL